MHEVDKTKLSDQTKFRLYEIKKLENFINEINQKELCSKKLSKYVTIFDYMDKMLFVLSATSSAVSIISFISIIGVPAGREMASFTLIFFIKAGIIKKFLSTTIKKKKKYGQILMLAKSKYNSIEALISQASNDIDISYEKFITILKEKDRYERIIKNVKHKNENGKQEIIKFSSMK